MTKAEHEAQRISVPKMATGGLNLLEEVKPGLPEPEYHRHPTPPPAASLPEPPPKHVEEK
jgi:hypothetical protein